MQDHGPKDPDFEVCEDKDRFPLRSHGIDPDGAARPTLEDAVHAGEEWRFKSGREVRIVDADGVVVG
jgi:hypothetical protein